MRLTRSLDRRAAPIFSRSFPTLRVETPSANISEAAHITARSTRLQRSTIPSGKQVPSRSFGILSVMAPTWVSSLRSLKPLRDAPVSSHIASVCADITSLTHASASARASAPRPPSAIAPSNCHIVFIAVSVSVESFSWSNQILGRGPRFFQSALTPLFATRSVGGFLYFVSISIDYEA